MFSRLFASSNVRIHLADWIGPHISILAASRCVEKQGNLDSSINFNSTQTLQPPCLYLSSKRHTPFAHHRSLGPFLCISNTLDSAECINPTCAHPTSLQAPPTSSKIQTTQRHQKPQLKSAVPKSRDRQLSRRPSWAVAASELEMINRGNIPLRLCEGIGIGTHLNLMNQQ